jgi:hypothetical protein
MKQAVITTLASKDNQFAKKLYILTTLCTWTTNLQSTGVFQDLAKAKSDTTHAQSFDVA